MSKYPIIRLVFQRYIHRSNKKQKQSFFIKRGEESWTFGVGQEADQLHEDLKEKKAKCVELHNIVTVAA